MRKMEKVKAKADEVLSVNCQKEKSARFLNEDRIEQRSSHHILEKQLTLILFNSIRMIMTGPISAA